MRPSQTFVFSLCKAAKARNMTISSLEELAGVCPGYLAHVRRGVHGMNFDIAVRLAHAVGLPIDTLLTNAG